MLLPHQLYTPIAVTHCGSRLPVSKHSDSNCLEMSSPLNLSLPFGMQWLTCTCSLLLSRQTGCLPALNQSCRSILLLPFSHTPRPLQCRSCQCINGVRRCPHLCRPKRQLGEKEGQRVNEGDASCSLQDQDSGVAEVVQTPEPCEAHTESVH
ncbi:hypothetical protein AAT19DRAFT_15139 [Rhodotorula toruloides]|uniref:Uncharacterized protein n=1 Tax=Rhodotorula toruloides TaxID=5286 RepID=A0A2T0A6C3_RHOTO|nr:hypothetical protein AAT19DRAFT_15139 [Rhodotorula toruloides]